MWTNNFLKLTHLDGLFVVPKTEFSMLITIIHHLKLSTLNKKYRLQVNLSGEPARMIVYTPIHIVILALLFFNNLPQTIDFKASCRQCFTYYVYYDYFVFVYIVLICTFYFIHLSQKYNR